MNLEVNTLFKPQFVRLFSLQNLVSGDGQVFDCPSTTWCADHPEICVQDGEPACRLNKDCGVCHPNATTSCVSQKTYASCTDGILDTNIRYCQASKPYCSMRYNDDVIGVVCTNIIMVSQPLGNIHIFILEEIRGTFMRFQVYICKISSKLLVTQIQRHHHLLTLSQVQIQNRSQPAPKLENSQLQLIRTVKRKRMH